MDEQKEYAEMLEIPVNTCNITVKKGRGKRKGRKNLENVKEELINKINTDPVNSLSVDGVTDDNATAKVTVKKENVKKARFKITPIGVGITLVVALFLTIAITNAVMPSSGINSFLRSVFVGESELIQVDERVYSDFDVNLPYGGSLESGVLTVSGESSLYATCDGVIESVALNEAGKYDMIIRHNGNFSTLISGMDYAYFANGDKVYKTLPVGYTKGGTKVCFLDKDNSVIVNFTVSDNTVVWEA